MWAVEDLSWKRITVVVTIIGFLSEMRPMDSFLTAYLTGRAVNDTLDEISNGLTPITISLSVFSSLIVLTTSDYLRYKPVILFCGFMSILAYTSLTDPSSIFFLKVYGVCYSFTSADPAYYGYLYAMIKDKTHYQTATGLAVAGRLSGKSVSGILGQLVVYLNNENYSYLLFYTIGSLTFAFAWMLFLPSVRYTNNTSVVDDAAAKPEIFSREVIHDSNIPNYSVEKVDSKNIDSVPVTTNLLKRICEDLTRSYTDPKVLRWTLWHSVGMTGYSQILLYANVLYTYVKDESTDKNVLLNGLVNSLATISSAICAYKIIKINVDWSRHGDTFLALSSLILGLTMYLCYSATNLFVVYTAYICYFSMIQSVFVISISQIGILVKNSCYALVMGFSVFTGLVLSMISSTIITHLGISIPGHFLVYSCMFAATGIVYGSIACFNNYTTTRRFTHLPE